MASHPIPILKQKVADNRSEARRKADDIWELVTELDKLQKETDYLEAQIAEAEARGATYLDPGKLIFVRPGEPLVDKELAEKMVLGGNGILDCPEIT